MSLPSGAASTPRLALVGCGVVAETGHLPALRQIGHRPALLVEPDRERAERLAAEFDVPATAADHRAVAGAADAAVVAVPARFHAPIAAELLAHGVHVLVEKPMAPSFGECSAIVDAAREGDAVLAVGLMRRFLAASQWTKARLAEGVLGDVTSFDFRDGVAFSWPASTDSLFRRETSGGGVLMDIGPHALDQLLWWLGPVREVEYVDDALGGVEADCRLSLEMESGARGTVELSWTRHLRNTAVITGSRGTLEVALEGTWATERLARRPFRRRHDFAPHTWVDLLARELEDWLGAIQGGTSVGSASAAAAGIRLIERCYEVRKPLLLPWMRPSA